MKKIPTDFSQISLLSNQKAKLIYLKNSRENQEHLKLCKSFELAKHGIKTSHGKERKYLEKRLERHHQDSLNVDDIRCLRQYVGDATDENEFCSQFIESGRNRRTRSSSVLHNKKGQLLTREMSKLEVRTTFIGDLGKNMEFISNEQSKFQTNFPKKDNDNHSIDMPQMEQREPNLVSFAKSGRVGHDNHSRSCPQEITDAKISKSRSTKVQAENIVKQNNSEMLSGLTASSAAKPDMASCSRLIESSRETVYEGASACENSDENNNCLEERTCPQEEISSKVSDSEKEVCNSETSTDGQSSSESKETDDVNAFGQQICEQRKESKKGPVILKRLGPTPNECEEDVEETLQDENGATKRQEQRRRRTSMIQAYDYGSSIEKPRETFSGNGNDPPMRRRRRSWAGPRCVSERLFRREFPDALPHLGRNSEAGNGVGVSGLDNCDRASQKSYETAANDAFECARTCGSENLEAIKRDIFLQKSNSVPLGLGSRVKVYSEEPFYIRPRKLSRRPSWQSTKLSEETLKRLQEIADKAKSDNGTMTDKPEPETPLVNILPPITLQSIYEQQCNKEKREQEQERKQRGTLKKIGEGKSIDLDRLTERLKDCRYLRLKKDPSL